MVEKLQQDGRLQKKYGSNSKTETNKTLKITITFAVQLLAMRKRNDKMKRKGYSNR